MQYRYAVNLGTLSRWWVQQTGCFFQNKKADSDHVSFGNQKDAKITFLHTCKQEWVYQCHKIEELVLTTVWSIFALQNAGQSLCTCLLNPLTGFASDLKTSGFDPSEKIGSRLHLPKFENKREGKGESKRNCEKEGKIY